MIQVPYHIENVSIVISTSTELINNSVCEISCIGTEFNSTGDIRLGATDKKPCGTCLQNIHTCNGHSGFIRLPFSIVHPLYTKRVLQELRQVSPSIMYKKDTDIFYDKATNQVISVDEIREIVPENLIMTVLPVMPPICRPNVFVTGVTHDDDLTTQYNDILKLIQKYKVSADPEIEKTIKFRVKCLFDNSGDKLKHINGRSFTGIKERIVGKNGQIRLYIMGKRVDQSARTVISAEPTLEIDQLGVPTYVAETLYYVEVYYRINKRHLIQLHQRCLIQSIERYETKTKFNLKYSNRTLRFIDAYYTHGDPLMDTDTMYVYYGDNIHRNLMDNDVVLFNRQPTLHKHSMSALRVKVLPGKTFRINLAITKQFNADFDGDECNIHVPIYDDARAELLELASLQSNIINTQTNKPALAIVQDTLLGSYMMSHEPKPMTYVDIIQCLVESNIDCNELIERFGVDCQFTTLHLLSLALPPDMNWSHEKLVISNGQIISGVLSKQYLSNTSTSLIKIIYDKYTPNHVLTFINRLQWVVTSYMGTHGYTIGIKDCIIRQDTKTTMDALITLKLSEIDETDDEFTIGQSLNRIKNQCMKLVESELGQSRFSACIKSGAKGDMFNACQISSILGSQSIAGGRIKPSITLGKRVFVHDRIGATQIRSRGFIGRSFFTGLNAHEYFIHAAAGREGLIDTSQKTANSGYIQRKINKLTEDLKVQYDGTVRGNGGIVYSMSY